MVIGTILARFLENATGQNKVPATIFPSRFLKYSLFLPYASYFVAALVGGAYYLSSSPLILA